MFTTAHSDYIYTAIQHDAELPLCSKSFQIQDQKICASHSDQTQCNPRAAGSAATICACCSAPYRCACLLRLTYVIPNCSVLNLTWDWGTTSVDDNEIMSDTSSWFCSVWQLSCHVKHEMWAKYKEPHPQCYPECQAYTGANCSFMIQGYLFRPVTVA